MSNAHATVTLLLCLAALAGCSTPMMPPSVDAGAVGDAAIPDVGTDAAIPDAGPVDFVAMLDGLGVDTALPDQPSGLPSSFNPLGRRFTTFDPHVELYFAGWTDDEIGRVREGLLDDDFAAAHATLWLPTDTAWDESSGPQRAAVAIDADGDGIQEIAVVTHDGTQLLLRFIDDSTGTFAAAPTQILAPSVPHHDLPDGWFAHGAVAANLDADDAQELVVAYGNLYFFDDASRDFAPIGTPIPYAANGLSVAAGDFDGAPGDTTDELVVAITDATENVSIETFDGTTRTGTPEAVFQLNDTAHTDSHMTWAFVRAGNFDGDRRDEIAFVARRQHSDDWYLELMDDATTSYGWFRSFSARVSDPGALQQYDNLLPDFEVLDADGDGVDDVAAVGGLYTGLSNVPPSLSRALVSGAQLAHPDGVGIVSIHMPGCVADDCVPILMTHGQYSSEHGIVGRDQLIAPHPVTGDLHVGSLNAGTFTWTPIADGSDGDTVGGLLVAANVDADSAILRFTGDHALQFTDPHPIALLSAAPCYDASSGEMQNLGDCATSIGQADATTRTTANSYGESVSWSIGYEAELFGVATASFRTTFERSFEESVAVSQEVTQLITYSAGEEDSVVLSVVPFDVYYFEVVSAPAGSTDLHHLLSLDFPRAPQTLLVTQAFYDAHDGALRDTASMFTHTVGMPHTYPSHAAADAACAGNCFQTGTVTVGQGTGYTELGVSTTSGIVHTYMQSTSVEYASEVGAGGVTVGHSQRYAYGTSIALSVETAMIFTGRVGNVAHTPYQIGLLARTVPFGDVTRPTLLVDYWVE